jgi:hypothetical protein
MKHEQSSVPSFKPTYTNEELLLMISGMREASAAFYADAVRIGNHAFIEFTGLMNEYIKMCSEAASDGRDFTQGNIHTGQAILAKPYELSYLTEKLECIFGTTIAQAMVEKVKKRVKA